MFKKLILIAALGLSSVAFAGTEDWNGVFTVQDSNGGLQTVSHTPTRVKFIFFSAGGCIHLGKGSKINGIEFKDDINLCTISDIQTFTNEVQKIGVIVNKTVTPGSTYPG